MRNSYGWSWKQCHRISSRCVVGLLVLGAVIAQPVQAKPLRGKAGLIVRDASSGKPLAGASVQLAAVVVRRKTIASEPVEERLPAEGNTLTTDGSGFGMANVHLGETSGSTKRLETSGVAVRATMPGYKALDQVVRVYYAAFDPPRLVLDDVLLAPVDSGMDSSTEPQLLRPEASIEPAFGEEAQDFTLRVKVRVPRSLTLVMGDAGLRTHGDLLHVFVQETDGTTGPESKRSEKGYRQDLIALSPSSSPAGSLADGVEYSSQIRHGSEDEATVIDHLHLAIRAAEPGDYLMTAEGDHVRFTESKTRTTVLLGQKSRFNTVLLTVLSVPVRWAVGKTAEQARKAYERKFAAPPTR